MIAPFDVHYLEDRCASAAAVLFSDYSDNEDRLCDTGYHLAILEDFSKPDLYMGCLD